MTFIQPQLQTGCRETPWKYEMSDTKDKLTCAVYSTFYNSDTLLIEEAACRHGAYHHFESLYILYKYISGRRWWAKGYNWVGTPLSSQ